MEKREQLYAGKAKSVFATDDPTGSLHAAWQVKEQLRTLLNTGSLEDAGAAKNALADLVERAAMRLFKVPGEIGSCCSKQRTRGPAGMSVTTHST